MKNIFGSNLTLTLFGESHGTAIGAVLDGLAPGIRIDMEYIQQKMQQRKAVGKISTKRQEADEVEILSGVFNEYTTGTPLALVIHNQDTKSKDYSKMQYTARPSHADYTANCKYGGFQDYRGRRTLFRQDHSSGCSGRRNHPSRSGREKYSYRYTY